MSEGRAVIFDLEGTVIDTETVWDDIANVFLGRHGIVYDRARVKHLMMGRTIREGVAILQEHLGLTGNIDELTNERRQVAKELLSKEVTFIPGAVDFIRKIQPQYRVAVATSMERGFMTSVDGQLHLSELFDGHLYSIEDIGFVSKPDPKIFLYAASKIGTDPADCVVIEDAPNGVQAAKSAQMKCIALTTSTTREKLSLADSIVDSYSEINLEEVYART